MAEMLLKVFQFWVQADGCIAVACSNSQNQG